MGVVLQFKKPPRKVYLPFVGISKFGQKWEPSQEETAADFIAVSWWAYWSAYTACWGLWL